MTIEDDFAAVARELVGLGLSNGTDFRVETVPADGMTSSEYVGLIRREDAPEQFVVFYSDMGVSRDLLTAPDFAAARERFVHGVIELGAFHRHGPKARYPSSAAPFMQALGEATHPPEDVPPAADGPSTAGH